MIRSAIQVDRPTGEFQDPTQRYALALGCTIEHKDQFVYRDGLDDSDANGFEKLVCRAGSVNGRIVCSVLCHR